MAATFFPPIEYASPDGLLALGGDLSIDRLLDAYRHGIFPWPYAEGEPVPWVSPDPRAVLPLDGLVVSRRLRRRIRNQQFSATANRAFADVIKGCAVEPNRRGQTWLFPEMISAYTRLHRASHAHSVESWQAGELVGGVYGVAVGGAFCAESMFYRVRDASKVALYYLVEHLRQRGFVLLDIQQWTPHTGRLGAVDIPREEFLQELAAAVRLPVTFGGPRLLTSSE